MVPASTNSSRLDQTTHTLVLASSSSESSSLSSSHSSASIPEMGNPASSGMVTELPSTPSATSLPTFSLPPYLQGPKESSNNANFQGTKKQCLFNRPNFLVLKNAGIGSERFSKKLLWKIFNIYMVVICHKNFFQKRVTKNFFFFRDPFLLSKKRVKKNHDRNARNCFWWS